MKLSATRVRALRDPGRYSDGDGLHLFIHKNGRKSVKGGAKMYQSSVVGEERRRLQTVPPTANGVKAH